MKKYIKEAVKTIRSYDKSSPKKWTYKIAAFDLPVQVGSLTKLLMQNEGTRFAHGLSKKEIKEKIGDELADILTEVFFIAHELGIDIEKAFDKMLESDKKKISERTKKL